MHGFVSLVPSPASGRDSFNDEVPGCWWELGWLVDKTCSAPGRLFVEQPFEFLARLPCYLMLEPSLDVSTFADEPPSVEMGQEYC